MICTGLDSTNDKTSQNNIEPISSSIENNNNCHQENAHGVNTNVNKNIKSVSENSRQVIITYIFIL